MKNIGILEIHFHLKFLHTMMKICKTKDTKVTVFTTKPLLKRLETYLDDKKNYEFVLKEDGETAYSFLKRVEKICDERIDLLFVNTIQISTLRIPFFLRFRPKSKMILTVHMLNHWLKAKFAFSKNIFRSIDVMFSIFLIRKILLPKYDAINVIYPPMKDFVKNDTNYEKKVFSLPFNYYDKSKKTTSLKKDKKIRFVIPGLIETYRRNYDLALDVFERLFKKHNNKIILNIVGKPVGSGGKKIIERCENLKKKGYNITFSKGFVPEEEYNKISIESDIIFSPLNVKTKRDTGVEEIYGQTEGSALPFEAIQYCKPLIVPKEFNVIKEMKSSTIQYISAKDLEKKIIELTENKNKLAKLKNEAVKNSKNFSLEVLQIYFKKEILEKLDKLK